MELIQNWDNQDQQAKSFQMRYNLSKLNNWNYQTLSLEQFLNHYFGIPEQKWANNLAADKKVFWDVGSVRILCFKF